MKHATRGLLATAIVILSAAAALAGADPAVICESGKLKTTGKYASCRLSAESKAVKKGVPADYSKCESKFSTSWGKSETKAGMGVCPSESDEADIGQRSTNYADTIATLLAGNVPVECGNGVADGDDQCDGSDLDGQTCEGLGYTLGGTLACTAGCGFDASGCVTERNPSSGQTTSYGAGSDGDVQAGATLSYQDNGDGTITDLNTGLMWEKKVGDPSSQTGCSNETGNCANPHHVGNYYSWSATSSDFDGRAVSIFLNQLNNRCDNDTTVSCSVDADCAVPGGACGFAGHRDWRLPNIKELLGIVDFNVPYPGPTVDVAFQGASCGALCTDIADPACSCTQSSYYWSSSTYQGYPSYAWYVLFNDGYTNAYYKTNFNFVRAVRFGS